jgi:hypothetical protein
LRMLGSCTYISVHIKPGHCKAYARLLSLRRLCIRAGLQPCRRSPCGGTKISSGFHEKAGRCQGNTVESLPGWPLAE